MSSVRGQGAKREDSDLDVVVLVDENTPELKKTLDDIAYKIMWDNDFKPIISMKVFPEDRFCSAAKRGFFTGTWKRKGFLCDR